MALDCTLIGFKHGQFADHVDLLTQRRTSLPALRDIDLSFVWHDEEPLTALDLLTHLVEADAYGDTRPFHNMDFLWPTILYLGSYLHKHGYEFDYVNLFDDAERVEEVLSKKPGVVAVITTLYVVEDPIIEIVDRIRSITPSSQIVIGGPYVSNEAMMRSREGLSTLFSRIGADVFVISSEGESALVDIMGRLSVGESLDGVNNIAYAKNGSFAFTGEETETNTLEDNPVDYSLFSPSDVGELVSLRTAKSCPFSCAFCSFPARAGKYRYLPVELVERELDKIAALGQVTTLSFIDDTFNVPKRRFREVLKMMIEREYGFKWNSFYRSDHGDAETIKLMAEAGCEGVFLGAESGSDTILELMKKSARRHNYLDAIAELKANGITTHANFIVGFPGETEATVNETISLIETAAPDYYRVQVWFADPITPIWDRRQEFGIKGRGYKWRHTTMTSDEAGEIVDDLFFHPFESTWLTQVGCEFWSLFYLRRRGMSPSDVRQYLSAFNRGIEERIQGGGKGRLSDQTLAEILHSTRKFTLRNHDPGASITERDVGTVAQPADTYQREVAVSSGGSVLRR
jgi:radical SAM PhpK family P-methyltransferase